MGGDKFRTDLIQEDCMQAVETLFECPKTKNLASLQCLPPLLSSVAGFHKTS
jgi:hypothetical protein